jgi:drug/metabolite transporter (DMT)-like permease
MVDHGLESRLYMALNLCYSKLSLIPLGEKPLNPRAHQLLIDLLLLLVAFFWGTTFIIVKNAVSQVGVYEFLLLRFTLAFVLMVLLFFRRIRPIHPPTLLAGAVLGAILFSAFAFQTWGLTATTATITAFITGLNVIIVPILSIILLKRPPAPLAAAGVLLAAGGLYILTGGSPAQWTSGEFLVFLCAVSVAFHILLTGHYAVRLEVIALATWQLGTVAALSLGFSLAGNTFDVHFPASVWAAAGFTAVFATVFAFAIQTYSQRYTPPTRTALIFTAEPVFGALFAHWYGGEGLLKQHLLGGGLIFLSMVLAQIKPQMWIRIHALGQKGPGAPGRKTLPIDIP